MTKRVEIYVDEMYPYYGIVENPSSEYDYGVVEVSPVTLRRWQAAFKAFYLLQDELKDLREGATLR